jgi:hypothetical protein
MKCCGHKHDDQNVTIGQTSVHIPSTSKSMNTPRTCFIIAPIFHLASLIRLGEPSFVESEYHEVNFMVRTNKHHVRTVFFRKSEQIQGSGKLWSFSNSGVSLGKSWPAAAYRPLCIQILVMIQNWQRTAKILLQTDHSSKSRPPMKSGEGRTRSFSSR